MIYAVERIEDVWDELLPNLYEFYVESGLNQQGEFNPSLKDYKYYQDAGAYVLFTGRVNGKLIAHCGMYLTKSMYTDALVATEDGFYVKKEYRKDTSPIDAYNFIENEMYSRGAKQIVLTPRMLIDRFMKRLGYEKRPGIYYKFRN